MKDRFKGALLGLAVGDALGMPVEGMSASTIRARYGEVREFLAAPRRALGPGQFTDDTQMTLALAESIVERGRVDPAHVAGRFMAWLDSGDVRGIGRSTLRSLLRLKAGVPWRESGEQGKWAAGNGAAMRIAPVGLLHCRRLERLRQDVHDVSIITHRNPEAVAGALAVAYAVARLVTGAKPSPDFLDDVASFVGHNPVSERLRKARELLSQGTPAEKALASLGTSGYVVETVASALYAFLSSPDDFEETVVTAVMAGGDTDTVAAIAGAISGAHNGVAGIPSRWRERVEGASRLAHLAERIYELALR